MDDKNENKEALYSTVYYQEKVAQWVLKEQLFPKINKAVPTGVSNSTSNLQFFLSHTASRSQTHFDDTPSTLTCIAGMKHIWLAPPGVEKVCNIDYWTENNGKENKKYLAYNPSEDMYRSELWQCCTLVPGETLFLPAKWWHDVHSPMGTVAVSINLVVKRTVKSPVVKAAGVGGVGHGGLGGSGSSEERMKKGKKRMGQQGSDIRRVVGALEQEDESGSASDNVVVVVGKTRKM